MGRLDLAVLTISNLGRQADGRNTARAVQPNPCC